MADLQINDLDQKTTPEDTDELEIQETAGGSSKKVVAEDLIQNAHGLSDGIVKVASSVMAPATQGTDYYAPGGTDVAVADGGTGGSDAATARTNLSAATSGANTDITSVLLNQTGLAIKGASANPLVIRPNETLSATRTLSVVVGDSNRSLTLTGDTSLSGTNTGDQTNITGNAATVTTNANLTGDVTSVGNAATLAAGSASVLNSGTLPAGRLPALTGDVTSSAGSAATTIANDAVTYAKMQNVSATDRVLGRSSSGAGDVEEITTTGSGNVVRATSATLVTPALGTPSAIVLTSGTGLPVSTGISGLGTGVATFLATPSSANLAAAITDETGSGANVFATSPALVTPDLGTPSAAVLTNATGLPASGIGSGTIATARLGSGTAASTAYLTGDSAWTRRQRILVSETGTSVTHTVSTTPTTVFASAYTFAAGELAIGDMIVVEYNCLYVQNASSGTRTLTVSPLLGSNGPTAFTHPTFGSASAFGRSMVIRVVWRIVSNTTAACGYSVLMADPTAGSALNAANSTQISNNAGVIIANITSTTNTLDLKFNYASSTTTQSVAGTGLVATFWPGS